MSDKKELNLEEMDQVNGGFMNGELCAVTGTKNFLAFRNDVTYEDSNIVKKFHNGDGLIYLESAPNGYAMVQDPSDGSVGYVNEKYLI